MIVFCFCLSTISFCKSAKLKNMFVFCFYKAVKLKNMFVFCLCKAAKVKNMFVFAFARQQNSPLISW